MALTIHKLDKIVLPSSVVFSNIKSQKWSPNIQSLIERPAGHLHPMFVGNQSIQPGFEFSTTELDVLLAACPLGGASLGSSTTYFKLGTDLSSAARAAASHKKIVIASSLLYWTNIRLPHNGAGEASVMLAANYDGSNDPFVYSASVALAGNLTLGTFFGAGPVSINGSVIPGIQEITIDSGIKLLRVGANSEEFDTFIGIETTDPVVTIKTSSLTNWATVLLRGLALNNSTGLVFYARKFTANPSSVSRVADATAEHVKFVALLGQAIPVDSSGSGAGMISDTIRIICVAGSDSIAPLVPTASSAIT